MCAIKGGILGNSNPTVQSNPVLFLLHQRKIWLMIESAGSANAFESSLECFYKGLYDPALFSPVAFLGSLNFTARRPKCFVEIQDFQA